MSLARVVPNAATHHQADSLTAENAERTDHNEPPLTNGALPILSEHLPFDDTADHLHLDAQSHDSQSHNFSHRLSYFKSPPDTPATRTGPPRSLSFAYSFSNSPSRHNSGYQVESSDLHPSFSYDHADNSFSRTSTDFRGVLESLPSRDQVSTDRKGKRRETRSADDGWTVNPIKWFHESPKDEHSRTAVPWRSPGSENVHEGDEKTDGRQADVEAHEERHLPNEKTGLPARRVTADGHTRTSSQPRKALHRALSLPHTHSDGRGGKARWAKLRSLLPNLPNLAHDQGNSALAGSASVVASPTVNITDELITGGLSTLMLRLWFDRDEKGHRRVPILLHRLRIRISDSYHPTEEKRTAFRIECEYANGAARWVVYRQLRDFFSLHTHYTVSNVYNRLGDELPEFPLTSECHPCLFDQVLIIPAGIPYLKFLKKEDANIDQASFARLQREALETYLIKLIRAVVS